MLVFHLLIGGYDPARFARRRTSGTRGPALYVIGRPGFSVPLIVALMRVPFTEAFLPVVGLEEVP